MIAAPKGDHPPVSQSAPYEFAPHERPMLPGSPVRWRFQVAQGREALDEQIAVIRRTLVRSFALLGLGLVIAFLLIFYAIIIFLKTKFVL